jgi:hypothetical protein
MTVAVRLLSQSQLGNTAGTLYTAPAYPPNAFAEIWSIWVANTDSVARTVTLRMGSGTLTTANSLLEAVTIAANSTMLFSAGHGLLTLSAGYILQGFADVAAKVTVTISGVEGQ